MIFHQSHHYLIGNPCVYIDNEDLKQPSVQACDNDTKHLML